MDIMILEDLLVCESYIDGKMTKRFFIAKGHRTKECLELVDTDVYEPFSVQTWEGYGYFISFIYEYSKFRYEYIVYRKANALNTFVKLKA